MNRSRSAWWSLHRRKGRRSQGPEAAMFQGLRTRLTLWYCGVLGAALVLFSVVLYLAVQFSLLAPVEADTALHAHAHVNQRLAISPARACLSFVPPGQFGAPEPNGERVCGCGADWRVHPGTGNRAVFAAHPLARCWGSGTARRGTGRAVPGESCAGASTSGLGTPATLYRRCRARATHASD